ncbi:hypothetical protein SAMN05421548_107188 [Paraburkholderia lycopersici]|uniref:Uncharacterized protein n=1 Tax=Paraburkholderia lycopersici TaxID=416944 RepID=A0A1G6MC80_9BURK|nr:hypothetical protein SAMN05421548_107188 [Paraburkholderia lycopersici]
MIALAGARYKLTPATVRGGNVAYTGRAPTFHELYATGARRLAGATSWLAYRRGDNPTHQDVRYASSVVRDIAPEGGRSVMAGLRTTFQGVIPLLQWRPRAAPPRSAVARSAGASGRNSDSRRSNPA